jgi:hypothetical protein
MIWCDWQVFHREAAGAVSCQCRLSVPVVSVSVSVSVGVSCQLPVDSYRFGVASTFPICSPKWRLSWQYQLICINSGSPTFSVREFRGIVSSPTLLRLSPSNNMGLPIDAAKSGGRITRQDNVKSPGSDGASPYLPYPTIGASTISWRRRFAIFMISKSPAAFS